MSTVALPSPPLELCMLADAVGDGVILFDEHDRVVFVNRAARQLLQLSGPQPLRGLSSHNVFMGQLRASGDALGRMRTGDEVPVRGPSGDEEVFVARYVQFPARPGTGIEAGLMAQEPPTAIVFRDRRAARKLRRIEDASVALDRPAGELLGYRETLRVIAKEIRRASRDREPLSVVVVAVPAGPTQFVFGDWLTASLRGPDRAGHLESAPAANGDETTASLGPAASEPLELDAARAWACVVLPETGETGAHAVALRLSTRAREAGLERVDVGVASCSPADDPTRRTALALLRSAVDDLLGLEVHRSFAA